MTATNPGESNEHKMNQKIQFYARPELAELLKKQAKKDGTHVNAVVLRRLCESFGIAVEVPSVGRPKTKGQQLSEIMQDTFESVDRKRKGRKK